MEVESSGQKQKKRINGVSTRGHGGGAMGFTTTTAFASPQVDPDLDFCMEHRRPGRGFGYTPFKGHSCCDC